MYTAKIIIKMDFSFFFLRPKRTDVWTEIVDNI